MDQQQLLHHLLKSYDIDIDKESRNPIAPAVAGELFMKMRRFVPDFKSFGR